MKLGWRGTTVFGLLALLALVGGVGGWVTQTEIDGAVVAPGQVAVRGRPQTVQHLDGGIVKVIHVQSGETVEAGTTLLELDDTTIEANLEIYLNRLREALAREARLIAELRDDETVRPEDVREVSVPVGDLDHQLTKQIDLLSARRELRLGQVEQQGERIVQLESQIEGFEALIDAREDQLGLVATELEAAATLVKRGLAPTGKLTALQRERADLRGQVAEYRAEIARTKSAISETRITRLQIDREHQQSVLDEENEVSRSVDELVQQLQATEAQLERVTVRAPTEGRIHELTITTVGGVISPGAPILQIIPMTRGVEVEVSVNPGLIDRIYAGQSARLRFPAFNQRTTPQILGSVSVVSPSSIEDQNTGQSFYRAMVEVPEDQIALLGVPRLTPGMPVEAYLITDSRTVAAYLTRPITDYFARSMRER